MIKLISLMVAMFTTCSVVPTDVPNEKIAYGTFTRVGEEGAQFKSYDDSVWWYLEFAEIGEKPQVNQPYALTYDTNNTESCAHTDCDNCWREDDVLKKLKKIEKNY